MSDKLSVVKVVLSTGKVAFLKEMKISHSELAAQQVSAKANGDANILQLLMQKSLVQILLIAVAPNEETTPKRLSAIELEDMDSIFSIAEYTQILKAVGKMAGGDDLGKAVRMEMVADLKFNSSTTDTVKGA